jgi:hypothetical protein
VELSETLRHLPVTAVDFVFVAPGRLKEAQQWLQATRAMPLREEEDLPAIRGAVHYQSQQLP